MSTALDSCNAIQNEMTQMLTQTQNQAKELERRRAEIATEQQKLQDFTQSLPKNQESLQNVQKHAERLQQLLASVCPMLPPEAQMLVNIELDKVRQEHASSSAQQMQAQMMQMQNPMNQVMTSMMAAHAAYSQGQALQASRSSMMGMTAPSPRMAKPGMQNGMSMSGMPNGMMAMQNAAMAANLNMAAAAAAGMPPNMAQLQAMAAYGGMGGMGMPGLPGIAPAQLAAMQQAMAGGMMPPISGSNAHAMAAAMAMHQGGTPSQLGVAVSTPSRNASNGTLSGTRTPQSVHSPRTHSIKSEVVQPKEEKKESISPTGVPVPADPQPADELPPAIYAEKATEEGENLTVA